MRMGVCMPMRIMEGISLEKKTEKEQWTAAAWDMLYLVQCGINSVVPDPERVAKMDLEKVYARSKSQSLEALTYMALESLLKSDPQIRIPDENQVLLQWKEEKNKAIAKNLMMDAAREQLFAFMEKREIWHVALKGIVLSRMYPKYGMRQMADNDILFDPSFRQEVHDWFVEQGYEAKSYQRVYHDVYLKSPIYNFEMHTALFFKSVQLPFEKYYRTIKDKLLVAPGKIFERCMTDEDFYLYFLAHEYKHYSSNGVGLRFILDLYVYLSTKNKLNWKYLNSELEKIELLIFEKEMREIAQKIFDPKRNKDSFSKREKMVIKSLIFSRTYGARNDFLYNQVKMEQKIGKNIFIKLIYLRHRIFPDQLYMDMWCQRYAPYFFQHQWLMPIAPFWRIIKRGIKKRKQIKEELDTVRKS